MVFQFFPIARLYSGKATTGARQKGDRPMINFHELAHIVAKIIIATILGGLVGAEREIHGHGAGFRTHMMVSMGTAMFVMGAMDITAATPGDLTRVVQGIATGIGFLGAGTILKLTDKLEVKGLTTASSIWLAAAVGTATGLGQYALAIIGTVIAVAVLALLRPIDQLLHRRGKDGQ